MTQSRELTNYCQESVRPFQSRLYADILSSLDLESSINLIAEIIYKQLPLDSNHSLSTDQHPSSNSDPTFYLQAINIIQDIFQ